MGETVVRPDQEERAPAGALEGLAEAGRALVEAPTLAAALDVIADAAARATGAEVAVIRVLDADGEHLTASAVSSRSLSIAAELEGSRFPVADLPESEIDMVEHAPAATRRAAERLRAAAIFQIPLRAGAEPLGSVELFRPATAFDENERNLGRLAATQAALTINAFRGRRHATERARSGADALTLAGDALAAGASERATAEHVTRLAAEATGALAALLWRSGPDHPPALVAAHGLGVSDTPAAGEAAQRALRARGPVSVESTGGNLLSGANLSAAMHLGQPPVGVLQLLLPAGRQLSGDELQRLATFGVRVADALRTSIRSRGMETELERTRALLTVVGQAIAQLSLAHTLETSVARVRELLGVERLAIYLRADGRFDAAAAVGLAGPHTRVAERLLELALGPFRSRGMLAVEDASLDPRLASVSDAVADAGIEGAIAVPLIVHEEAIGLVGVFPAQGHRLTENESALLIALATQLAVAVQNAQLHEQAKQLGDERERALEAERTAARQLGALYEISRSFAQSLSLEATLDAVATTIVDVLDVDVAMLGMVDERREHVVPRAIRVSDQRTDTVVRTMLEQPLAFGAHPLQQLFRLGNSFRLTPETVGQLGGRFTALLPFLQRGWTGAVVPIATTAEVLASLTVLSLRPGVPVTDETVEQAQSIAGQAALAIDNARLYQQQKEFADTMQRSLLPRSYPVMPGLELGDAYQSSARVEVGGDIYDFTELDDGRLAVVLGDVTGHGIEAAADMAMAKFVFRSLAREHPEPGEFLRFANNVVVGEIAQGKFITMAYLVIDPARGEVAGAGAGHPPPRIVAPGGDVRSLDVRGLVLGLEPDQEYEELREPLEPGATVVLYTDGVIEARREGELYGVERLDALLAERYRLAAPELAQAVLEDCRDFAGGELADDCAVVVVRRRAGADAVET